jgi:formate dehydrogenase assembly factor FdhD
MTMIGLEPASPVPLRRATRLRGAAGKTQAGRGRSQSLSYEGAKHSTLTARPDDFEDFAVGFSYTKGNGAIAARHE